MTDCRYPFAAIVRQEAVKKALLYTLIEPRTGGVLLCGEKGTAKSTIVRGLAGLSRQKVIDLPLNITEDMLVGSIDFERAVQQGVRVFSGEVLQRAHENILYVDEVNLLPDGVVNTLICAAASGENRTEREGISHVHPCRFSLVGTMNPEEGRLRPQFLDRFGLYVEVSGEQDPALRAEIIRRRMAYEKDPAAFCRQWESQTQALRQRLERALHIIRDLEPDGAACRLAAQYARQAGAEGNRCEVVLARTAAAVAAWNGRDYLSADDMKEAAFYVLPHRRREAAPPPTPPETSSDQQDQGRQDQDRSEPPQPPQNPPESPESPSGNEGQPLPLDYLGEEDSTLEPPEEAIDAAPAPEEGAAPEEQLVQGENASLVSALPDLPRDRLFRQGSGRRTKTKSGSSQGRYAAFAYHPTPRQHDLALDATLRAAAPYQRSRDHTRCAVALTRSDLRYKVRESHVGATIVFAVDASGSMGAQNRMKAAKETVLSMLLDSYQKRDRIGLVAFRQEGAKTLLDITSSVDLAEKQLQALPTGGRTPLAAGLYQSWQLLAARRLKDPELLPMVVVVTDGRANRALWSDDPLEDALRAGRLLRQSQIHSVVIDTDQSFIALDTARQLAQEMGASYYKVQELTGRRLGAIVQNRSAGIGQ